VSGVAEVTPAGWAERTCAGGALSDERTPTDAELAAFCLDCEVDELPHQLVAAHEADLAVLAGALDPEA
jgi:hypothetical protein